jgi:hypothetical protein
MRRISKILKEVWRFYIESFKNLNEHGKRLALIIVIKLFILFGILKIFFFKEHIPKNEPIQKKTEQVINEITKN